MNEIDKILTQYHADKISKAQAAAEIQDLIDAERMTLRDEFAMCAPEIPEGSEWRKGEVDPSQRIARWNYEFSDAMLTERKRS